MDPADRAQRKYAVGSIVILNTTPPFSLRIHRHIAVQEGRRSQIFTATMEPGQPNPTTSGTMPLPSPDAPICVKIFDHDLVDVHDDDVTGTPAELCSHVYFAESRTYSRLATLSGVEIPRMFLTSTVGQYHAIVFEYIDQHSLSNYTIQSDEEMMLLEDMGRSAVEKLHEQGVYHGDIRASNIMWSMST